MIGSTPSISEFDPTAIPYQAVVIDWIRCGFDYKKSFPQILLSGSLGSSKSTLAAYIGITHCLLYPRSRLLLGRRALPDLKETIFLKIVEMIGDELIEGKDYWIQHNTASIQFKNGSEIISKSWGDGNFKKVRSTDVSCAIIEELTENDDADKPIFDEIYGRIGRLAHVPEAFLLACTNPDGPEHWVYKHFIETPHPDRHVFYSLTEQNKFLNPVYLETLKRNLDPLMAERMLRGRWVRIAGETIYYQYDPLIHYKKDQDYRINPQYPIRLCFDFNIGLNKPLSASFMQYIDDHFHIYDESVIHGARTEELLQDALNRDLIKQNQFIIIHGDASGKHRDTRGPSSDFEIIESFLKKNNIKYEMQIPSSNPSIRQRHILMNAYFKNTEGRVRITLYKNAKTAHEGFSLVKLKKGGQYIEDDSKPYQHITTAIGYGCFFASSQSQRSSKHLQL
jgi:PBSX family phage terminase large subunit